MKSEKLAIAGAISLAGSATSALAALALTVVVARGLGTYGTGQFFQVVGVFTIAVQILNLGTTSGIVRFTAEQDARGMRGQLTRTLRIALVPVLVASATVSIVGYFFADIIASVLTPSEDAAGLADLLQLVAPFVVIAAVLGVLQTGVRMTRGIAYFSALQDVLLPASRLGLVALAVWVGAGVNGVLLGWAGSLPFWLIVTVGLLVGPLRTARNLRKASRVEPYLSARRFWAFSWARAVGAALEVGLSWSDVLIVAAILSPAEAGVYAVATRAVRAGQVVDRAMRLSASPTIAKLLSVGDVQAATRLHTSVARAMILCTWPFYLTLATMGPAVMLFFGNGFAQGSVVLAMLAIVMLVASAAGILQSVLLMGGRSSWQMVNKALALGLSVFLNLILVPRMGIAGAALSWAIVVAIDNGIAAYLVHRRMGINLQPKRLRTAAAIPVLVYGLFGLLSRLTLGATLPSLAIYLVSATVFYIVLLWVFRERLEILSLWRILPRPLRRLMRI